MHDGKTWLAAGETQPKYFVRLKKSPLVTDTLVQIEEKTDFFQEGE